MQENDYYNEIKELLVNNEVNKAVKNYSINKSDLETYYNVGKLLTEAGKCYGEGIIKNYANRLIKEVGKKYDTSTLYKMRKYYNIFSSEKVAPMAPKLTWSHIIELLPIKDINEFNYYIGIVVKNKLSKYTLRQKIKSKEYDRLSESAKLKLINNGCLDIKESIPDPILINIKSNIDVEHIKEKTLHKAVVENIEDFMNQLGSEYTFVGSEYKIMLDKPNYIDILLFNIKYNAYVVVELKTSSLKSEHIGQVEKYVNYIDKNKKTIYQNKIIGLIIVKKDNSFVLEYSTDKSIISRTYELNNKNMLVNS